MTHSHPAAEELARWLADWGRGDSGALARLMPVIYDDLRRLARSFLRRERPGHSLRTTALVHELYLELRRQKRARFKSHGHFFAVAAQLMRRILAHHARRRLAAKRGGGALRVPLEEAVDLSAVQATELVALDDALSDLARLDPVQGQIVELRFYAGLSIEETAAALQVSASTVKREWRLARAWLAREIRGDQPC